MRQIVLDTETTGLSTSGGHRIIEIGCVELVNRRFTGRDFHRFLNPDRDIDEGAEAVHGISRAQLETEPRFPEIVDDFLEFIKDAELIIHNAEFDVGFIEHELRLMSHAHPRIDAHATVLDTLTLARELHPGQRNSLDALCKRYEIDASKRDVHGALIDSELLARVYLAMTGGQSSLLLDAADAGSGNGIAAGSCSFDARAPGPAASREPVGVAAAPGDHGGVRSPDSPAGHGYNLVVIEASDEEVAAHEAILDNMRESGACVWDFD